MTENKALEALNYLYGLLKLEDITDKTAGAYDAVFEALQSTGWQPISSYVTTVKNVLIIGGTIFYDSLDGELESTMAQATSAFWNQADELWEIANTNGMRQWSRNPTHYMHLPTPPDLKED